MSAKSELLTTGVSARSMDASAASKFCRALAGRLNLRVKFHKTPVQPHTNPVSGEIHVTEPNANWTEGQYAVWSGEILHELGHHRGENKDVMEYFLRKKIDMGSMYGTLVNVFADVVNDRQWAGKLDGASRDVQAAQSFHAQRGAESVATNPPTDDLSKLLCEVFSWNYNRRANTYQPLLMKPAREWENVIPVPAALEALNPAFDALSDGPSIEALIEKILPPEEIEKAQQPQSQEGEGEEGDGESEEGKEGKKAKGKAKGKLGDEEGEEVEAWVSYKDLLSDNHATKDAPSESTLHIAYDHEFDRNDYIFAGGFEVKDPADLPEEADHWRINEYVEPLIASGRNMAKTLAKMINIRSERGTLRGQKSGRLDSRAFRKIPSGYEDIFKVRTDPIITKDCAIQILGDMSGSMDGEKYYALCASFALLNEACKQVGIPYELTTFTQRAQYPDYYVVKGFNGRAPTSNGIIELFNRMHPCMGSNADGEALLWAWSRLSARKEKKKILIVLSDGQPWTAHVCGDAAGHLKKVCEFLEKRCTLIGIGLQSESVKYFYKNYKLCYDTEQLEKLFLELLRDNVI